MAPLGKALMIIGLAVVGAGAMLWLFSEMPLFGKLPGDIYVRRGNFSFYFPIMTCVLISIVISILFSLMRR